MHRIIVMMREASERATKRKRKLLILTRVKLDSEEEYIIVREKT
jgi:hypothetical protein